MSERKVLNKYYPPDFDPSIIPRQKKPKNDQYKVRLMAPFNMRCITCGVYIYKATKFNARKETVEGEEYLGIKIFRFYIRCPKCHQEITFKTDPENADYLPENGISRNFELWREVGEEEEAKKKKKEAEEENNAMKALENRTKQSKREMDMLDTLEEIRDMNSRNAQVDINDIIAQKNLELAKELELQKEKDEALVEKMFASGGTFNAVVDEVEVEGAAKGKIKTKRLAESDSDDGDFTSNKKKAKNTKSASPNAKSTITDALVSEDVTAAKTKTKKPNLGALLGIVKKVEAPKPVTGGLAGLGGYGSSSEDSS